MRQQFAGFGTPDGDPTRGYPSSCWRPAGTGLSVAFDLPTLMGRDPDHELSRGEVRQVRRQRVVARRHGERSSTGIDLGRITTSMTINSPASMIFAMYLWWREKTGADWQTLSGRFRTTSSRSSSPRRSTSSRRARRCG
jgi:methylmalonyl-CoA mutase N-terminal domain/subunit